MLVSMLLKNKGDDVQSVGQTASLTTAAAIMVSARIGALVVEAPNGDFVGLISEREITSGLARWAGQADRHIVSDVMIARPPIAKPCDTIVHVMALMTERRARHIPIVEDGQVIGILSIGDILKSRLDEKIYENQVLQDIARWPHAA